MTDDLGYGVGLTCLIAGGGALIASQLILGIALIVAAAILCAVFG